MSLIAPTFGVLCRSRDCADHVCNHPTPNHKWGGGLLKHSRETPWLCHWNTYPSKKLFLLRVSWCGWLSILASPLNFNQNNIVYPDPTLVANYMSRIVCWYGESQWGNQHRVRQQCFTECDFKPLSQGCIPKVYFYSLVNGYGSKPPYGCKIEWSWWKMGKEITEWGSWCHTGLSFLLFSMNWLSKYTRSLWDWETVTGWVHEGSGHKRHIPPEVGRFVLSGICFTVKLTAQRYSILIQSFGGLP